MAEITKKETEKSDATKVVDSEKKEEVKEAEYIPTIEEGQCQLHHMTVPTADPLQRSSIISRSSAEL